MKVLYLASRYPWPPHRGDRLTGFQLIRALSRRHEVTLASFTDGHETMDGADELVSLCRRIEVVRLPRLRSWFQAIAGLALPEPSQVSYYRSSTMAQRVARLVAEERPDAIFVQLFRMAPFVERIAHPCKVLFFADSLALSLARSTPYQAWHRRAGVAWERRRVAAYEPAAAKCFRESWVLSAVDAQDLRDRGCPNVEVVPHGVDERLFDVPLVPHAQPRVTFLGNLSVPHNIDAAGYLAREIWPRIFAARPDAELEIVGADAVPAVRALGELPGVRLTGAVPSLLPVWERSGVVLAPLRYSAGIQNKVLEPMAAGVPVVTTPQVAAAIGASDGVHLDVAAGSESLADAALARLAAPESGLARARAARELVRANFSWQTLVNRLEILAAHADD